jgi:RNA polymerase sigma factor (TIGR02999 family)
MDSELDITRLLAEMRDGEREAFDRLFPLVYQELRGRAHRLLMRERSGDTIDTTALVHEAYVRLAESAELSVNDRGHFFALASRAMRHILVDYARRSRAQKRGGGLSPLTLDPGRVAIVDRAEELIALHDALDQLAVLDERLARNVELRFFGGLTIEETAEVLDVSPRTVRRDWRKARALLYDLLHGGTGETGEMGDATIHDTGPSEAGDEAEP